MMSNRARGVIYICVTADIAGRAYEHRNGVGSRFTSRYNCKKLVWFELHPHIVLAIAREKRLKEYKRDWKINLIEAMNPGWHDLYDEIYEHENVFVPPAHSTHAHDYCTKPDPADKPQDDGAKDME